MVEKKITIEALLVDHISKTTNKITQSVKAMSVGLKPLNAGLQNMGNSVVQNQKTQQQFWKNYDIGSTTAMKRTVGFGKTMKMSQDEFNKWNAEGRKGATRMGKFGASVRQATQGTRGFRMELLGVMFFGMMMQRTFKGLIQPALDMTGAMTLLSTVLGIMFLPLGLKLIDFSIWLLEKWQSLDEKTQQFWQTMVLLGLGIGTTLMIIGQFGLAIGSIIGLFGFLLVPLGLILAGMAIMGITMGAAGEKAGQLNSSLEEQFPWWEKITNKVRELWATFKETEQYETLMEWWNTIKDFAGGIWDEVVAKWKKSYLYAWLTFEILKIKQKWKDLSDWWEKKGSPALLKGWNAIKMWWKDEGSELFQNWLDFFKNDFWPFFRDDLIPFVTGPLFTALSSLIELIGKIPAPLLNIIAGGIIGGLAGGKTGAIAGMAGMAYLENQKAIPDEVKKEREEGVAFTEGIKDLIEWLKKIATNTEGGTSNGGGAGMSTIEEITYGNPSPYG